VIAQTRTARLAAMGFATVQADLTDPATHDPAFWRPHLAGDLIYAAGLLTGSAAAFAAVHQHAPAVLLAALPPGCKAVLISAVGVAADTPFARWRRQTEAMFAGHAVLRPGLVLADTSYGGSSLLRALAALPLRTPVVGDGRQRFNPVHAADLAGIAVEALTLPHPLLAEIGGEETMTQAELVRLIRAWLGLRAQPMLPVPLPVARWAGRVGDALRLGPISATAVDQLQGGVLAQADARFAARGVSAFVMARPAGTQDLWQARLYLLKPVVRLGLAALWLGSAALGLLLPATAFPEVDAPVWLARLAGLADLGLGLALIRNHWPRAVGLLQLVLAGGYTIGLTGLAPGLWLDPYGGLLKNLPILVLILIHLALAEER